jgi:hypothetical protein
MRWLTEANVSKRRLLVLTLSLSTTLPLVAASCGSVGNSKPDAATGTGGAGTGGTSGSGGSGSGGTIVGTGGAVAGTGGAVAGTGGTVTGTGGATSGTGGASDAAVDSSGGDTRPADGGTDAGPLPVSCLQIKQQNPSAANGVFTISPLGTTSRSVFCEMTLDGGGWTAFYIGDNGSTPGGMHFENAADYCPDPVNSCIRRLPANLDTTHDFAVKCGAAVAKFKLGAMGLDYFTTGLPHSWQPVTGAVTIDVVSVAKANLVANLWTGDVPSANNPGWIISGSQNTGMTFANAYTPNTNWNQCNGAADSSSRVMLFYR